MFQYVDTDQEGCVIRDRVATIFGVDPSRVILRLHPDTGLVRYFRLCGRVLLVSAGEPKQVINEIIDELSREWDYLTDGIPNVFDSPGGVYVRGVTGRSVRAVHGHRPGPDAKYHLVYEDDTVAIGTIEDAKRFLHSVSSAEAVLATKKGTNDDWRRDPVWV